MIVDNQCQTFRYFRSIAQSLTIEQKAPNDNLMAFKYLESQSMAKPARRMP